MSSLLSRVQVESTIGVRQMSLLADIGSLADKAGIEAFLIGGAVRDAVLGVPSDDVDVMVVGDAIEFSGFAAKELDARGYSTESAASFKRYGTAKLSFRTVEGGDLLDLDFASARKEQYPSPGKAPVVEDGDLRSDLARRDFSINALAMHISPSKFGVVEDFHRGLMDAEQKLLRVLHAHSFIDDPARMIRLVRFEQRLGFHIEEETERLFLEGLHTGGIRSLEPFRLFDEFRKAFQESDPLPIVERLNSAGLLQSLLPEDSECGLRLDGLERVLRDGGSRTAAEPPLESWKLIFAAVWKECAADVVAEHIKCYKLPRSVRAQLLQIHQEWRSRSAD